MSQEFGYNSNNFECDLNNIIKNDGVAKFNGKEWGLNSFKIGTFNCLGLSRFAKRTLLKERLKYIVKEFKNLDLDIICLQEVSKVVFDYLKSSSVIKKLYYFSNNNINWNFGGEQICLVLSKIKPVNSKLYYLKGEHYYGICIVDLGAFVVSSIYLQAGSSEGGVKDINKYSKCRISHIKEGLKLIKDIARERQYFFLGDFNFHLDGPNLEVSYLKNYNFYDIFRIKNPNEKGYTEDTDSNSMRYNFKPYKKKVRYDGIFSNKESRIIECKLFGTTPIFSITESKFKKITNKDPVILNKNKIDWFISDHFGVYCELVLS